MHGLPVCQTNNYIASFTFKVYAYYSSQVTVCLLYGAQALKSQHAFPSRPHKRLPYPLGHPTTSLSFFVLSRSSSLVSRQTQEHALAIIICVRGVPCVQPSSLPAPGLATLAMPHALLNRQSLLEQTNSLMARHAGLINPPQCSNLQKHSKPTRSASSSRSAVLRLLPYGYHARADSGCIRFGSKPKRAGSLHAVLGQRKSRRAATRHVRQTIRIP